MQNRKVVSSQGEGSPGSSESASHSAQRDLADKQSVRTSFRLSEDASNALVWLAKHHGIKFKDVFDYLCDKLAHEAGEGGGAEARTKIRGSILDYIASSGNQGEAMQLGRTSRKTHVISKGAFLVLKDLSKKYRVSRDHLVDISILRLHKVALKEREREKEQNEKALKLLTRLHSGASQSESELKGLLGKEHPIAHRFGAMMVVLESLIYSVKENLNAGVPIDPSSLL